MKHAPATSKPRQPATRWPIWIAISVEFGPGMRLVAPRRSRNSSCVSQPRRGRTHPPSARCARPGRRSSSRRGVGRWPRQCGAARAVVRRVPWSRADRFRFRGWEESSRSGRGGIRTLERLSALPVFKTGAIDHSATLPDPRDRRSRIVSEPRPIRQTQLSWQGFEASRPCLKTSSATGRSDRPRRKTGRTSVLSAVHPSPVCASPRGPSEGWHLRQPPRPVLPARGRCSVAPGP